MLAVEDVEHLNSIISFPRMFGVEHLPRMFCVGLECLIEVFIVSSKTAQIIVIEKIQLIMQEMLNSAMLNFWTLGQQWPLASGSLFCVGPF